MSLRSRMQTWLPTPVPNSTVGSSVWGWFAPNSLSLLRVGLAFGFPFFPPGWRAGVIVAAALSDLFDGRLSRALHGTSPLGQILDPVADKLFVGVVLSTLLLQRQLTLGELVLVGFRDLAVTSGSTWSVIRRGWGSLRKMPPSLLGKFATAGQFTFLFMSALDVDHATSVTRFVELAAATFSILAGIDYLCRKTPETGDHETPQLQHP
jgi:cardiolipin synthase (CMP-forming)